MVTLLKDGDYSLLETKGQIKILILDKKNYAFVNAENIGQILVSTYKKYIKDVILAKGPYRVYQVKDEPSLTDLIHLELFAGKNTWQGYLLPTGFPSNGKKRSRIIPTGEVIGK